ncbi:KTSC domain-containing protein [Haladaptatus salinisoli]|uniref:KTSC domain-containing protein n=1 Tax=Haladaptatus salinisoli TaxID=2884876 RepID=UPI001D0B9B85|nr:KTSC domain-containing protein [Haladaptatus salinisoli]
MKAHIEGGEPVECDEFEEAQRGIVLRDREQGVVGYVPYEKLEYVTRTRTPVTSSNLASVGYDPSEEALEIEFHSGGVYRYRNVPQSVYQELLSAGSHGSYFHENVRDEYDYRRIR